MTSTTQTITHAHTPHHTHAPLPATTSLPKDLLGIEDLGDQIPSIIQSAMQLKSKAQNGEALPQHLSGTATALVFENPSTRTRVSLELGIARLGGATTTLDAATTQLGRGESIEDTAGALSRYAHAIVVRAKTHSNLEEFARCSQVPVINALTDKEHPLQALADIMTIAEAFPSGDKNPLGGLKGLTLAWIGDGDNVCCSLLLAAASAGMKVKVATPAGHEPDAGILHKAQQLAAASGGSLLVTHDPQEAAKDAHVIETDTWRSMGTEEELAKRYVAFQGFTVDAAIMKLADPEAIFLHCMPGHWGEEATHAVAHGPQSRIFDEAENRMWTQMGVLTVLMHSS